MKNGAAMSPIRANASNAGTGLTSPHNQHSRQGGAAAIEDEKTAEEKAEEKKKMDMMRKFYRNRYSSFL